MASLLGLIVLFISFVGGKTNNLVFLYNSYSNRENKKLTKYVVFLPKSDKKLNFTSKNVVHNNDNYKDIFDYQLYDG